MVVSQSSVYASLAVSIALLLSGYPGSAVAQSAAQEQPSAVDQPVPDNTEQERVTHAFDRDWLVGHAQTLSGQEFDLQVLDQNSRLNELGYNEYRRISFDPHAAIWARQDRNFMIDMFHPGFLYRTPVAINLVVGGVSRRVLYNTDIFQYGEDLADVRNEDAQGYSGFRVYHPINSPDRFEEFLVFQGASYFRSTAKDQFYGLSARGLAINTARP
jgi:periplasmic glucans biosynthesis protein